MNDVEIVCVRITGQEFHTVLAALRYYQMQGLGDPAYRPLEIHAIASNDCNLISSLDSEGIDNLCIALNRGSRDVIAKS